MTTGQNNTGQNNTGQNNTGQNNAAKRRPFLRYVAVALLVLLMPFFVLAATVAATGTVSVSVEQPGPDGVDLWLPVPALLVDLAVFAAPHLVPEHELAEARREAEPYLPALEAMAEALEDCPEGVHVEVKSHDQHFLITKTWRSFHVDVQSPDTNVQVEVPARLLGRVLDVLG